MTKALLAAKADPNDRIRDPFALAIRDYNIDKVRAMVEGLVDLDATYEYGYGDMTHPRYLVSKEKNQDTRWKIEPVRHQNIGEWAEKAKKELWDWKPEPNQWYTSDGEKAVRANIDAIEAFLKDDMAEARKIQKPIREAWEAEQERLRLEEEARLAEEKRRKEAEASWFRRCVLL